MPVLPLEESWTNTNTLTRWGKRLHEPTTDDYWEFRTCKTASPALMAMSNATTRLTFWSCASRIFSKSSEDCRDINEPDRRTMTFVYASDAWSVDRQSAVVRAAFEYLIFMENRPLQSQQRLFWRSSPKLVDEELKPILFMSTLVTNKWQWSQGSRSSYVFSCYFP